MFLFTFAYLLVLYLRYYCADMLNERCLFVRVSRRALACHLFMFLLRAALGRCLARPVPAYTYRRLPPASLRVGRLFDCVLDAVRRQMAFSQSAA